MGFLNLKYSPAQALTIVEDAIQYAVNITNNLLYEVDLNSPYRILLEAQVYVYNFFLQTLNTAENLLLQKFLQIMGFTTLAARESRVMLKFELNVTSPPSENVYIPVAFPVKASNGQIFTTDATLLIPNGTTIGFVWATSLKTGLITNVGANTITQPLRTIDYPLTVTNPNPAKDGLNGETTLETQLRLAAFIRKNGLITADDYVNYVREQVPNAIVSVASLVPNTVTVWVANQDGTNLNQNQFIPLQSALTRNKLIGMGEVSLQNITVVNVYVSVICAISQPTGAPLVGGEIRDQVFDYLKPDSNRQVESNTKGVIVLKDLERVINLARIDYIFDTKIGLTEDTAYGQNFVFNVNSTRVNILTLDVTLIKDTFRWSQRYTR